MVEKPKYSSTTPCHGVFVRSRRFVTVRTLVWLALVPCVIALCITKMRQTTGPQPWRRQEDPPLLVLQQPMLPQVNHLQQAKTTLSQQTYPESDFPSTISSSSTIATDKKSAREQHDHVTPSTTTTTTTPSDLCESLFPNKSIMRVQMPAVPSTASTSTDTLFKATMQAWHKPLISYEQRGFTCPTGNSGGTTIVEYNNKYGAIANHTVSCILNKFRYRKKSHANYNQIAQRVDIPFTIFKQPYWTMQSHYVMRKSWDQIYEKVYPEKSLVNVTMDSWIQAAWWRHNLFVKMLATDTSLIWGSREVPANSLVPTKEQSDEQNALGEQSVWLQTALQRLDAMPVFGLHHRLPESFELFGFRLCFPVSFKHFPKQRIASPNLQILINQHNRLDNLLLQHATVRFDEMIRDMRQKKAQGILCDLGQVLDRPGGLEMGLQCAAETANIKDNV